MRYIELAQWVNDNAYTDNCDWDTAVKYIYILVRMLAVKDRMFNDAETYDQYAMFCATVVYKRLISKNQYILDEQGNPKTRKLENVLEYIKTIMYPCKVDFQNDNFYKGYITEWDVIENTKSSSSSSNDEAEVSYNNELINDFSSLYSVIERALTETVPIDTISTLNTVTDRIKSYIHTMYDDTTHNNIYISCLLTFISYFRNNTKYNLRFTETRPYDFRSVVVLFHLPKSMEDFVVLQCRIIKQKLFKELSNELIPELMLSKQVMRGVIYSGTPFSEEARIDT